MRLRYLHLPNYGVLKDVRVTFDRDAIFDRDSTFDREDGLHRKGSLHFVVGLNGTGKSSLLRALYETFRWLEGVHGKRIEQGIPFPFPISLVYDLPADKQISSPRTCVFHHDGQKVSEGFFYAPSTVLEETGHGDWDGWIAWLNDQTDAHRSAFIRSDQFQGSSLLQVNLPDPLIAYTSGSLAIWNRVHEPELPSLDLSLGAGSSSDDRPRGWNAFQELAEADAVPREGDREALQRLIDPSDLAPQSSCLLLEPQDLKLAAIAVGIADAVGEADYARRNELIEQVEQQRRGRRPNDKTARTLLNEVDWWYPTHLSMEYRPTSARMNPEWRAQMLVLCALADEVIRQPLGRMQMVINLGQRTCRVEEAIRVNFPDSKIPPGIQEVVDRAEGVTSGAEAVLRVLQSSRIELHDAADTASARWGVFRTLHSWRAARFVDDLTVTIKRVTQMPGVDGEPDDVVLTWEDLSDGEQMLLGRMSLLLLSGRDGSLLLLDELETHFNDSWKREIIDIVDDNVLKTTEAHVVVATHTSIALTDAFASEIIRLVRDNGGSVVKPVSVPTFGAATTQIMAHVFDMPAAIGSRAEQALRAYLKRDWTSGDAEFLETLLANIGRGWPMAKLQETLDRIQSASQDS